MVVFNLIFSENRRWKPNRRFFHNSLILRLFVCLCMYYSFFGFVLLHVIVILMIMLLCFAAMPYYCHSTLLLLHLCCFSICFRYQWHHLKLSLLPYLIVSPSCCSTLLLSLVSCVSLASSSTLPFFPIGFGFWSLKK